MAEKRKTSQKRKENSKKRKPRNKRSQTKYPALKPELNLRSRWELIDYDYIDKLSEKDKAWLNKFTEEYVNANLDRKNLKNNLHTTMAQKIEIDAMNNRRRDDAMTRSKAQGNSLYLEDLKEKNIEIKEFLGKKAEDFNDTSNEGNEET